jgi:probable F420-dependent oxidoreductase
MSTPIGILLDRTTNFLSGERLAQLVKHIETLGFESVWLLDAFGRDPFVAASFILANTSRLKVGTSVATVHGRDATAAVQALHTLSEFYPNRFYMGLGASNPVVVGRRKGTWVAPLPKMRAYLEDMAGVTLAAIKPPSIAPIYIAAHAPKLQALAAERTQGIITWMMPPSIVAQARQQVGPKLDITAQILSVITSDAAEARRIARTYLAMYLALPYYQEAYARAGFSRDECTEGGGSDRLIDSVLAWGTPEAIRERLEEFSEAGATRIVVNPLRIDTSNQSSGTPVLTGDWEQLQLLPRDVMH